MQNIAKGLGDSAMKNAGWLDLWHHALTTVASQPPFVQIVIVTGIAYVLVMALEGTRASILAIWHGHRTPAPPPPAVPARTVTLAAPAQTPVAAPPPSRSFSAKPAPRAAAVPARRPKAVSLAPRQFRAPRPKIRRQTLADAVSVAEVPNMVASAPLELTEAV